MTWVRPAYHRDAWPAGDDRQLINLDQYRVVRLVRGTFGDRAGWAIEALVETMTDEALRAPMHGRTALLAVLPAEAEERAATLLAQLQERLAAGARVIDLNVELPPE
jgi:hypothetical protein